MALHYCYNFALLDCYSVHDWQVWHIMALFFFIIFTALLAPSPLQYGSALLLHIGTVYIVYCNMALPNCYMLALLVLYDLSLPDCFIFALLTHHYCYVLALLYAVSWHFLCSFFWHLLWLLPNSTVELLKCWTILKVLFKFWQCLLLYYLSHKL